MVKNYHVSPPEGPGGVRKLKSYLKAIRVSKDSGTDTVILFCLLVELGGTGTNTGEIMGKLELVSLHTFVLCLR